MSMKYSWTETIKKLTSDDPAVAWRGTVVEQQVLYCSKIYNEHKNTAHLYTDKFDAGILPFPRQNVLFHLLVMYP